MKEDNPENAASPSIQSRPDARWYFAYGSNLDIDQKVERTGAIRAARRCQLPGYRLAFNKRGSGRSPVFANIMAEDGAVVWGVAYLCSPEAFDSLDTYEGVRNGHYKQLDVEVVSADGVAFSAIAYVATPSAVCAEGQPSDEYLGLILQGACHHHLPPAYIDSIERLARPTGDGGGQR